ncbi:DUF1120 domain-containing protein [Pseudomonas sp. NPDC098747]|uniref:DUF1120 domain-containing protein n=1 Tax=Pseudomonas sp. NPDC098747 TaxID=3364487 RepID=UPI00383BEF09
MKKLILLPLALALASNAALAANSVDLRVTGTITPAACDITLAGGAFDLGSFDVGDLNATGNTRLPVPAAKNLSVICSAPTLVGITVVDNRPNTVPVDAEFGLGSDGAGADIGWYIIDLLPPTVDTASGVFTQSENAGATWTSAASYLNHNASSVASWNTGTGTDPIQVTTIVQPITVSPVIYPTNNLDTSSEITFDGSATIELVYL